MRQISGTISINDVKMTINNYGQNTITGNVLLTETTIYGGCSKEDVLKYCKDNGCLTLRVIDDLKLYELMTPHEIAEIAMKEKVQT